MIFNRFDVSSARVDSRFEILIRGEAGAEARWFFVSEKQQAGDDFHSKVVGEVEIRFGFLCNFRSLPAFAPYFYVYPHRFNGFGEAVFVP